MTEGHEFLYEFGPYTLDGRERVLLRDGRPVSLAPKAVETLLVLIRNSGHLVEKEQLMSEIWPETYVEESNLTQNISILRKVLSDGSNGPSYIETVPRRGYRFTVTVRKLPAPKALEESAENEDQDAAARGDRAYRLLAILPFVNAGADPKMEYLSDGITESIINTLSQLPQLRVMSRNAAFRYKGKELDAQRIGKELSVDAVLVGRVHLQDQRLLISTELVDVANGWQLWGDNYDRGSKAIFDVQEEIAKQISAALRLRLTGEDEQRLTKRYTESAEAYQAYLQGRYHWSKFTREGLEHATIFFRQAIDLDSNYALAYAGIVDCYLRLATNYIPPAETKVRTAVSEESELDVSGSAGEATLEPVKTRYEWDWTGVERELKRATELKANYPAAHQWHAAYIFSLNLFRESVGTKERSEPPGLIANNNRAGPSRSLANQIRSANPTPAEEVQVFCAAAREQMEAGNYEGGSRMLKDWWTLGGWPKVEGLSSYSAGDLLFTAGALTGWIASARQIPVGQKHAEALISGSIGIFEHLGAKGRSCEGKIELGYCYYREGFFDLARTTIVTAINSLPSHERELRSLGLIRVAIVERHAGRLAAALSHLNEAAGVAKSVGPWATGRYHLEVATTLKNMAAADSEFGYLVRSIRNYQQALCEFEAVGNHRYAAIVENNHGYLLLDLEQLGEAKIHLLRARNLFDSFGDKVCGAQVNETLARLHLAEGQLSLAQEVVERAVDVLERSDGEALLAEALITRGLILARMGRYREAKRILDRGNQLAERCGDNEGAVRALLVIIEEMADQLVADERNELAPRLRKELGTSQPAAKEERLKRCLSLLASNN